jgi:ABC-type phosphate transport system substrate-binding protein
LGVRFSIIIIFLIGSFIPGGQLRAEGRSDFVLVINASLSPQKPNQRTLRSLFSLKKTTWMDGTPVQLVVLPSNDPKQRAFVETQLNLFSYQLERLWTRQVFAGSAKKPIVAKDFDELINIVASTPGAIGFIPADIAGSKKYEKDTIILLP